MAINTEILNDIGFMSQYVSVIRNCMAVIKEKPYQYIQAQDSYLKEA